VSLSSRVILPVVTCLFRARLSLVGASFWSFSFRGGPSSSDLAGVGKEAIELQAGYPSEIRPPSYRVWSRRVTTPDARPAGGISLSPSLFDLVSPLSLVWLTKGAPWLPRHLGFHWRIWGMTLDVVPSKWSMSRSPSLRIAMSRSPSLRLTGHLACRANKHMLSNLWNYGNLVSRLYNLV
jgi:hypothetical protein